MYIVEISQIDRFLTKITQNGLRSTCEKKDAKRFSSRKDAEKVVSQLSEMQIDSEVKWMDEISYQLQSITD